MSAIKARSSSAKAASASSAQSPLSSGETNCIISKGTKIDGGFRSAENIRLDGTVEGTLQCDRRLVLGQSGRVQGDVQAENAVISGTVEGNVRVSGTLQLTSTAKIAGDLNAKFLVVEEGAVYDGRCQIGG